jgi:hypothetical protein
VPYRSHPVRRICDDPLPEESVTLIVEYDPAELDPEELDDLATKLDGTFEEELPYDSVRLTLPEPSVTDFCEIEGVETVETANVTKLGDAGEDVEPSA